MRSRANADGVRCGTSEQGQHFGTRGDRRRRQQQVLDEQLARMLRCCNMLRCVPQRCNMLRGTTLQRNTQCCNMLRAAAGA
jgi:hypothetical protein